MTRFLGRDREAAVPDALRSLTGLDWSPRPDAAGSPAVLTYLPAARGNPFQSLLYNGLPDVAVRPTPAYDAATALRLARALQGGPQLALHLHWLNVVTARAADERAAAEKVDAFLGQLDEATQVGARLIWTVHNVMPHDSVFPEQDARLRRAVVARAERVHVMSRRTVELVAPIFPLPAEKVLEVPHPSYDGVYSSHLSRSRARQELGVPERAVVHLVIGALKPYKGLTELSAAFDEVTRQEPGRHVLLAAGAPDRSAEARDFARWAGLHPAVVAFTGKVPSDDMQVFLKAADLALFPYRRSLNSGALALTCTFGLPAVLAGGSGEAAEVGAEWAEVYDPTVDAVRPLVEAILTAANRLVDPAARAASRARSDRNAAPVVAARFARGVRDWLDSPSRSGDLAVATEAEGAA